MKTGVYMLMVGSTPLSPDVIYSRDTGLKIGVHEADMMHFAPDEDEIQLYGYLNGSLLVFETIGITADDALEVLSAIIWYTRCIGYPDMEILPDDPRMAHEIAI